MAALPIRLQYLWADEAVMAEDFRRKISMKMGEYARDFYGRYGFELDVRPGYEPGKVLQANRFALTKNGGVKPDPNAALRILAENLQRVVQAGREFEAALEARDESEKAVDVLVAKQKAAAASNDAAALKATVAQLEAANARRKAAKERYDVAFRKVMETHVLDAAYAAEDFETKFRVQMGDRYLAGLLEFKRLNIVFCKYVTNFLTMRGDTFSTTGNTFQGRTPPVMFWRGTWLWPSTFVCLSIDGANPKNLAHEIVHAAGHGSDPPDVQKIKDLKRYVSYRPKPRVGSLLDRAVTDYENYVEYQSLFENVQGGYFAGEGPNDIMNYYADNKDPFAATLADSDKNLLTAAFFVR